MLITLISLACELIGVGHPLTASVSSATMLDLTADVIRTSAQQRSDDK